MQNADTSTRTVHSCTLTYQIVRTQKAIIVECEIGLPQPGMHYTSRFKHKVKTWF